ncbi:hypothetical protein JHK85_003545 [Glycine max]|nr:hypothetical protein JHK85_003545 [Glycine max]KAG5079310.1 hypothetical protein JHK86_003375 [Glycine max]
MTSNFTIEQRLEQLQKAKEEAQPQPPKKAMQNPTCSTSSPRPKAFHQALRAETDIILGPIHHGAPKLQLGEQYKQRWAARYIDTTGQTPQDLHNKVLKDIGNLNNLFDDDLLTASAQEYQKQGVATIEEKICWMMGDVLLLKNQLPFPLLQLLWRDTERVLMGKMRNFLRCHHWATKEEDKLPEIVVDDTTAATVLNLIAYEMCPDFENDYGICSYVSFLDSLIDHPDDVKALRSEQILLNSLGSDEKVANLFNTISTDLVPDMGK